MKAYQLISKYLQLFRSLHLPLTSRMLSEILSRLVETVAEQGEDMQVINRLMIIVFCHN